MTSKFSFGMIFGGDILLKEDYPVLFHVACDRDATVAQFMDWSNCSFHCNPGFLRTVRDCELEFLICFLEEIYSTKICQDNG